MKLTDPTEDQINAAVAEHVAGWRPTEQQIDAWVTWAHVSGCDTSREAAIATAKLCDRPAFTRSADAVLPLLEKMKGDGFWVNIKDHTNGIQCGKRDWLVIISNFDDCCDPDEGDDGFLKKGQPMIYREGVAPTFPLAACIALLRAKGIEVVFTKTVP